MKFRKMYMGEWLELPRDFRAECAKNNSMVNRWQEDEKGTYITIRVF